MSNRRGAQQTEETFRLRRVVETKLDYLLFRPRGRRPRSGWPLILFLHGAGERGSNLSFVAQHGIPKVAAENAEFPFIAVSPQCPASATWCAEDLMALLDHVMRKQKVDRRRVYATGLSMGGYAVWSLAVAYPRRFAAVAPICGGSDTVSILLATGHRLRALRTLPIWAFHGAQDDLVSPEESQRMVEAFRRIGNSPKLTLYSDLGHDCWTRTYANPELYEWLLSHRR